MTANFVWLLRARMICLFYVLFWFGVLVSASGNPTQLNDRLILKVTSETHDRFVVYDFLQALYVTKFAPNHNSRLHIQSSEKEFVNSNANRNDVDQQSLDERACVSNTQIKYYLKAASLASREYEASECRINLSNKYKSVLSPTPEIHQVIHSPNDDRIMKQLEFNLMQKLSSIPQMAHYEFYNFTALNYSLECLLDYQELGQVKLKESNLEVSLERVIEVSPACGFKRFDENFDGRFIDWITVFIPLSGSFYCKMGRSATCKHNIAESSNSRYKLFGD